ncbi:GGDEF domain-containing protein [Phenylobacterium sp.]|uniref:GGDEF domain-containing protein n=1 Tax=Phenylobacterium sp. TaxID=1871053 RepID=UPI002FD8C782
MKITGARNEPFAAIRKRALAQAGAQSAAARALPVDQAGFLGVSEAEMTPAVRGALTTLLTEIDDLRGEVARLKAKLAEAEGLADRDPLTPLLNRRAFMRELARVQTFSRRYSSPASLIYFDLDDFKSINDRFGHAAGDAALKTIAERLTGLVRESDIVARMGGDEFAVLLVQATQRTAEAKAEALARTLESSPIQFGDWSAPIHLSYGVREIPAEGDAESIVAEADAAMFLRKRERHGG